MTEQEAKTKWCPFRTRQTDYVSTTADETTNCIASSCMMWRKETHNWIIDTEAPVESDKIYYKYIESDDGFCSLAGFWGVK